MPFQLSCILYSLRARPSGPPALWCPCPPPHCHLPQPCLHGASPRETAFQRASLLCQIPVRLIFLSTGQFMPTQNNWKSSITYRISLNILILTFKWICRIKVPTSFLLVFLPKPCGVWIQTKIVPLWGHVVWGKLIRLPQLSYSRNLYKKSACYRGVPIIICHEVPASVGSDASLPLFILASRWASLCLNFSNAKLRYYLFHSSPIRIKWVKRFSDS